jgi:hypothetical protein
MKILIRSTKKPNSTSPGETANLNLKSSLEVVVGTNTEESQESIITGREQYRYEAMAKAQARYASLNKEHTHVTEDTINAIKDNEWGVVANLLLSYSKKTGSKEAKAILTKMINRATSIKEMIQFDKVEGIDTEEAVKAYSRGMEKVRASYEKIIALAEVAGMTIEEANLKDAYFDTPDDPAVTKLRREVMAKGIAQGYVDIACVMSTPINRSLVQENFNAEFQGSYLILKRQLVVGMTSDYARKVLHRQGESKEEDWHDIHLPTGYLKEQILELGNTVSKRSGNRYQVMDETTTWSQASWSLLLLKSDLNVLAKAGGGRFKLTGWSFAYRSGE